MRVLRNQEWIAPRCGQRQCPIDCPDSVGGPLQFGVGGGERLEGHGILAGGQGDRAFGERGGAGAIADGRIVLGRQKPRRTRNDSSHLWVPLDRSQQVMDRERFPSLLGVGLPEYRIRVGDPRIDR